MVQYKAIGLLVMADQYDLSIGVIFNDLERPPDPHFKVTPIFDDVINGTNRQAYYELLHTSYS